VTPPVGALVRDMMMPQLGHGRVATAQPRQGTVTILYSGDPTTPRELRWDDQKDVVRARLHPGQRIQATLDDGRTVEADVARALGGEADAAWRYALLVPNDDVGTIEVVLTEDRLAPLEARSHDPRELLAGLVWDDPGAFFARAALLRRVAVWYEDSFGIPALLGARVHFLPHQLHAARRVLTDRRPRFVLADEVGLGKTIEAGLIAQSLTATEPGLRVLVIAPGSMSRQWLCELFLRFGEQVFVHLDVSRLALDPPDELYARPRIVVSTTAL
jgi:hypothetical protein